MIAPSRDTPYQVVLPFYIYAAIAFLAATVLLFGSSGAYTGHFFHPAILAVTHTMALGWGTMIILGASHQLVPVLAECRLFSVGLAYISFILAAAGIPLLIHGFYTFRLGWAAQLGGIAIVLSILCFVVNLWGTIKKGNAENVHAIFALTASCWLLLGTATGLLLVYNFTGLFLPKGSLIYLPLHAHIGIIGWFLLLVIGVGSRLIPMFLLSKYTNERLLWRIYYLVNGGLLSFILLFFLDSRLFVIPIALAGAGLVLFGYYCRRCYGSRFRKRVDGELRVSLVAVGMMGLSLVILLAVIGILPAGAVDHRLALGYGFFVFFGWITAIILGMTFKTLPFIVWNKVYHARTGVGKTPNPRALVAEPLFVVMMVAWVIGFLLFTAGVCLQWTVLLTYGSGFLVATAVLYNLNVFHVLRHQPEKP